MEEYLNFPQDADKLIEYIRKLKGRKRVTIIPFSKLRSENQNRFYWRLIDIISEYNGDDPKDLNKHYIDMFANKIDIRTSEMSVELFIQYLQMVQIHAYQFFGITYPPLYEYTLTRESYTNQALIGCD